MESVYETFFILKHYGVVDDEIIAERLERTVDGIQYRYRKIKGSDYVASLIAAGIQNPNLGQITHFNQVDEIVIPKKPSFLKRWKMRRLEKKALKAKVKAANLSRKLKKLEELQ